MVTAQSDNARVRPAVKREGLQRLTGDRVITERRERRAVQEGLVTIFDLLNGILVVVWRNGDIPTVDYLEARQERVDRQGDVVAAVESEAARSGSDTRWTKPCTRAIRCAGILIGL